ncbi:hypothetical protein [Parasphingorhabdus sp.]|uniref:hypothetical protein n=1 Tax=Parasphingorhabdus sp. TaxID=2709688 RepID=UPI00326738B2
MDLVFHLGLTKTGSSFLQHKVFDGKIHTLDRSIGYEQDVRIARQFQDFFLKSDRSAWRSSKGRSWFDKLNEGYDTSALISHESLYDHIPFIVPDGRLIKEPELLSERLASIGEFCWPHGNVKVFFFFRRQADWFASIYSHVAYTLSSPSQEHFERSTREILAGRAPGSHVVDYARLHEALANVLGPENVLALPYEAFADRETWGKIKNFSNLPIQFDRIQFTDTSVNTKRQGDSGKWRPASKITLLGRSRLAQSVQRMLPTSVSQSLKKRVKRTFEATWNISMPDDLRDEIQSHYAISNQRLSDICGVDLAVHQYFPPGPSNAFDG